MLKIKMQGTMAVLEGNIPSSVDDKLRRDLTWVSPLDFSLEVPLYADKILYAGSMKEAQRILGECGLKSELIYENGPKDFESEFLGKLWPLQDRLTTAGLENRCGFLSASPGTGKTVILSFIASALGKKGVLLVEAEETFEQGYDTLRELTTMNVGRIGAGYCDIQDFNVCMVQTIKNRIKDDSTNDAIKSAIRSARVLLIDEAHNAACAQYNGIIAEAAYVEHFLSVSATPFRADDRESLLYGVCGPILAEITLGEAIEAGLLVPFSLFVDKIPAKDFGYTNHAESRSFVRRSQYAKVVKQYITNNEVRHRRMLDFADFCVENGQSVAIIVKTIKHGRSIAKLDPEIVEVYGPTKRNVRHQVWEDLRKKKIMKVVTTLMDEGTNIQSLGAVILAAPGKSRVKLEQRLRNLRTFEGQTVQGHFKKERALIYLPFDQADFVRSHSEINLQNMRRLVKQHPENETIELWKQ